MSEENKEVNISDGGVSQEMVETWKHQYRKVFEIEVRDEDSIYRGWYRRPDMNTLSAVVKLGKSDEIKASVTMADNCWLGGAPEMKEEATIKLAAIRQLDKMTSSIVSTIKKV